jgi:hypothetical protein
MNEKTPLGTNKLSSLDELRDQFATLPDALPRRRWAAGPGMRASGLALLAVAALALASLTPPGRAIATDLGQLVGIGDEPTRDPAPGERAVVIGTGDAAKSYRYEVVAETNHGGSPDSETCIYLEFPELGGPTGGNCITSYTRRTLPQDHITPPFPHGAPAEFGPDARLIVQGLVTPDVAQVTVTRSETDGSRTEFPVEFSSLNEDLSRKIGVEDRAGFFFALLPEGILQGESADSLELSECSVRHSLAQVDVTALDASGNVVAHENLSSGPRGLLLSALEGLGGPDSDQEQTEPCSKSG